MKKQQPVEKMVRMVREAEALLAQGKAADEVCRQLNLSESTLVRWRQKYGGQSLQLAPLKDLHLLVMFVPGACEAPRLERPGLLPGVMRGYDVAAHGGLPSGSGRACARPEPPGCP